MAEEDIFLEHSIMSFPPSGVNIKLYEDGRVVAKEWGLEGEIQKEARVSPEQARSYADKLVQAGFFNFKDRYEPKDWILDGCHETTTLNYKGKSKTVNCENEHPPSAEFNKIIAELVGLVR